MLKSNILNFIRNKIIFQIKQDLSRDFPEVQEFGTNTEKYYKIIIKLARTKSRSSCDLKLKEILGEISKTSNEGNHFFFLKH
jgi:hypothetical protein